MPCQKHPEYLQQVVQRDVRRQNPMSSAGGKESSLELGVRGQGHLQELWINFLQRFLCIFVLKDLHCKQAELIRRKLHSVATEQFWGVPIYPTGI